MIDIKSDFDAIYVVSDPHFSEANQSSVNSFVKFVNRLPASNTCLVLLGDLFEIWSIIDVKISAFQHHIFGAISEYQNRGGVVVLLAGNRDLLFKDKDFDQISRYFPMNCFNVVGKKFVICRIKNSYRILFHHGHKIKFFNVDLIPNFLTFCVAVLSFFNRGLAQKYIKGYNSSKRKVSISNQNINSQPNKKIWLKWLNRFLPKFKADLGIIGHFHPKNLITIKANNNTTGIVVTSWIDHCSYLYIDKAGYNLLKYNS